MIYGINPYVISNIYVVRFWRFGPHPAWTRVMRKRNPIRGFLGFYDPGMLDCVFNPYVGIYGANGCLLKEIPCTSHDSARQLRDQLCAELHAWVNS